MRTVKLEGGSFKIRETPKELPANRFKDHQKYLVLDSGIGSQMSDIDTHYGKLDAFMQSGRHEEAAKERENLHYNLYASINRISWKHFAFLCLVESINESRILDYSEENMLVIIDLLSEMGLTEQHVCDILEDVKKKSIQP